MAAELLREDEPAQRRLAWRPALDDIATFAVETAQLCVSRHHRNDARSAAIYLARQATDEVVGAIGAYFGGVSTAAISKAVARAESRRETESVRDRRLTQLADRLTSRRETRIS